MGSYFKMWRNILNFRSRSSRGEFWGGLFWSIFVAAIFGIFDFLYIKVLWYAAALAAIHILPLFSLLVRRFHDVGHSGVWIFVLALPLAAMASFMVYYHYFDDGTGMYFTFHELVLTMMALFALTVACSLIFLKFLWGESTDGENRWGISPVYLEEYEEESEDSDNTGNIKEESAGNNNQKGAASPNLAENTLERSKVQTALKEQADQGEQTIPSGQTTQREQTTPIGQISQGEQITQVGHTTPSGQTPTTEQPTSSNTQSTGDNYSNQPSNDSGPTQEELAFAQAIYEAAMRLPDDFDPKKDAVSK